MLFSTIHWRKKTLVYLLLLLIVAAGFFLRTWNINFDLGMGSHPDERSTTCFYGPSLGLPGSWEEFKDPQRSPLNQAVQLSPPIHLCPPIRRCPLIHLHRLTAARNCRVMLLHFHKVTLAYTPA